MKIPHIDLDINKVVRILVGSDVVLYFGIGLFAPVFAIYITRQIENGTIAAVGIATSVYWVARMLTAIPLSKFMDKTDGENDEFYFLVIGTALFAAIFIAYTFASRVWHVYVLQAIYGVVNSMIIPAWRIVFTNHLDQEKIGYYWSVEDIGLGLAIAGSASLGALMVERFGFDTVLYLVAAISLLSSFILMYLRKHTYTLKELRRLAKERKKLRPLLKSRQSSDHGSK